MATAAQDLDPSRAVPVRERLGAWLTERIGAGEFAAGARIPSINDLAGRFALSRETVRRALDGLVARGLLLAEHGRGYFVNRRARRAPRVALLAKLDGVYVRPIAEALTRALGDDAAVVLADLRGDASPTGVIRSLAYQHAVDRLLVVPPRGREAAIAAQLAPFRRYARVGWLDRAPRGTRDATFLCDYRACVALARERFARRGIARLCYFGRAAEDRSVFSAMRRAFAAGERADRRRPLLARDVDAVAAHARAAGRLGVLAETDAEAVHLQCRLLARGVAVPGMVEIVACDDSPLTALVAPTISAVDPGFAAIGAAAAAWARSDAAEPARFVAAPRFSAKESSPG